MVKKKQAKKVKKLTPKKSEQPSVSLTQSQRKKNIKREASIKRKSHTYKTSESFVLRRANKSYKLLTKEVELETVIIAKDPTHPRHRECYSLLVERNQRIVSKVAFRYSYSLQQGNKVLDVADLVQEGNLGIFHAIDKYDPTLGFRFLTYAYYWIEDYIKRAIKNQNRLIRVPIHVLEEMVPVQREWRNGIADEHKMLSSKELAQRCGVSKDEVELYRVYLQDYMSLDDKAFDDNDKISVGDLISDRAVRPPEAKAELEEDRNYLLDIISTLDKADAEFIKRRFGLKDSEGRTRLQMAEIYRITEQRVTKTEKRILSELKTRLDPKRLNLFFK